MKTFQGWCTRERSGWIGTEIYVVYHGLYISIHHAYYIYVLRLWFEVWKQVY